ncbi:MAG: sigma 54-interacting transcriptional regulator [Myxococcaceae bacterium]
MSGRDKGRDGPDGENGEDAPPPVERDAHATATYGVSRPNLVPDVRRFRLRVVDGPGAGQTFESTGERTSIGSHPLNDVLLDERTVSRFHCELVVDEKGVWARDLGSRNGTDLDGVLIKEAAVKNGSLLKLGRMQLRFEFSGEKTKLQLSEQPRFGSLVGSSVAARMSFALMERAAASDVTVLLEGETGTGKSQAAESIHRQSARRDHAFLVVDCGALPPNLLESELFGHEKGAFTGAVTRRVGVFEEARGGTVFLDEVGELPLELQPKLLRVLEARDIRRLGTNVHTPVDVRIVTATNRDLRAEVNAGRFRSDLYFRLAVVKIPLPPLRQRSDDIPAIVEKLLSGLGSDARVKATLLDPAFVVQLQRAAWPGNIRELRNHLERCVVLQETLLPGEGEESGRPEEGGASVIDPRVPYPEARRRALDTFERLSVEALLQLQGGKVSQAAASADIDRVHLYRLIKRHRVRD